MTNTVSRIVSDETLDCIIQIESGGDPRAKARTSTATGLGQFLVKTWLGVIEKHRPDLYTTMGRNELLALRTDPAFSIEMLARFTEDNLKCIGMNASGGDLYLAHFLGVADARDLYRAPPETPVSKLVSPQVIAANLSILEGKSAGQVRAWAAAKMAKAGGRGWVKKFYKTDNVVPLPPKDADDYPDPQDAPKTELPEDKPTVVVPADAPPAEVEKRVEESAARDHEPGGSWIKRQWKKLTGVAGGFLGMGTGFVFDWKLMAVILGSLFLLFLFMIFFMGPGSVREWVRRQVQ